MTADVVVLGSGYGGAGAIRRLEATLDPAEADLTWISDVDHHLVLHEAHRCIREPDVATDVAIPIDRIKAPETRFVQGRAVAVDRASRTVSLADDTTVAYDYLVVAVGSRTAFFGIDGLAEHAHTLKRLDDAIAIHDAVATAGADASTDRPARVVVGGAGLSGIQSAGEIAAYRDEAGVPIEITLVEGLDSVFPNHDPVVQAKLRRLLDAAAVTVKTGEFVSEVADDVVHVGEETRLPYDVLVWTGGITGRAVAADIGIDRDDRSNRLTAGPDFRTSDDRIFALGDAALVGQLDGPAPPTAQAAWQAAAVAGANVTRAIRGQPLTEWEFSDKGTVVSVGDRAVAHNVAGIPIRTFGGAPATILKKAIAARWIADVVGGTAGLVRAARAWSAM